MEWMKKHKYQLLGGIVVLLLLAVAFFFDERNAKAPALQESEAQTESNISSDVFRDISTEKDSKSTGQTDGQTDATATTQTVPATQTTRSGNAATVTEVGTAAGTTAGAANRTESPSTVTTQTTAVTQDTTEAATQTTATTQDTTEAETVTCTIAISCATILDNMDSLVDSKKDIIPSDGTILATTTVTVEEGQSVYDALRKACQQAGIPLDASGANAYGTTYVKGINNIYEFDCGSLSGWKYCVNGVYPNYGCSSYILKEGDRIVWNYTCTMNDL